MTDVNISCLPDDFQMGAVYLNQGDYAYAKIGFDKASINWFCQNLQIIADPMTRAEIWRYFWVLVREER